MNALLQRRLVPVVCLALLTATATLFRPAAVVAAPGDAEAQAALPEFASIPATHTNLVVVDDLLPTVRAAMASPRLLQPLNRFVAGLGDRGVEEMDLEGLVEWLQQSDEQRQAVLDEVEANVPKRITIATDDATIALLGQAAEAAAVATVAVQAGQIEAEENLAAPYVDQLVALAEGFVTPRASIVLTMRDPAKAMEMMQGVQMLVGFVGMQPGFDIQMKGNGLTVNIDIGATFNGDAGVVVEGLAQSGLGSPEDPQLQQLAAAIMDMTFRIGLSVQDDRFIVQFGAPVGEGEPTLGPGLLGELWPRYTQPGTGAFFLRFSPEPLAESFEGIAAVFDIDPDSPLGQYMAENPDFFRTDPLSVFSGQDINGLSLAIDQMGTQQDLAVWLDGGLQIESQAQNVPPVGTLAPLNLPARLPGELPLTFAAIGESAGVSISTQASSILDLIEGEIKSQAMRDADWDEEKAKPIAAEQLKQLAPLRTLLTDRAEATFGAVSGGLAGVVETAETFSVTAGDFDNPQTVTLEKLPVPAGLLFVQLAEGQSGTDYLAELYTELVKVGEMIGEYETPEAASTLAEADLGLGVKTVKVDLSWVNELAEAEGEMFGLELIGASAAFHAFDFEGMLVLSTSPALSKRFMQAWNANGQPIEGQGPMAEMIVPEVDGDLVGLARMEPSGLAFSLRQAADSVENVKTSDPAMIDEDDFGPAQAATMMRLVADLMEELALSEFVIFDRGNTRITEGAINLSRQLN